MKERNLQMECVKWLRIQYPHVWVGNFSTDTRYGGTQTQRAMQGAIKNKMGYTKGLPDLLIIKPSGFFSGLFVEFKTDKGRQTPEQKEFEIYAISNTYAYVVVRTLDEFMMFVKNYFNGKNVINYQKEVWK